VGTHYIQTKSSATNPFTIAIIETEVTQLEIGGLIDHQAKGSRGVETAPVRGDRHARIHQARAAWRDPADVFAASGGRGTLVSGLDYDGLQDGESFDPQRNMGPTSYGSEAGDRSTVGLRQLRGLSDEGSFSPIENRRDNGCDSRGGGCRFGNRSQEPQ
jgi:hypothetical protein